LVKCELNNSKINKIHKNCKIFKRKIFFKEIKPQQIQLNKRMMIKDKETLNENNFSTLKKSIQEITKASSLEEAKIIELRYSQNPKYSANPKLFSTLGSISNFKEKLHMINKINNFYGTKKLWYHRLSSDFLPIEKRNSLKDNSSLTWSKKLSLS